MLTKMFYEGADYDTVLKEAQANGYAERNPEADVEGYDACRKIAILSSLISGQQVDFEDIYCEGITEITVEDMKYAKAMGTTIKLLASSKRIGKRLHAIVAPCMLYPEHPLYNVNDVFNAIFVHGNVLGAVSYTHLDVYKRQDVSCRKREDDYYIVTDRWQNYTDVRLTEDVLRELEAYCDEFLVHGVDVEGKSSGIDEKLARLLGNYNGIPVTYAGGIGSFEDLRYFEQVTEGKVDFTIGSALDLFGGTVPYDEVKLYRL